MMNNRWVILAIALLAFPQIAETIYSPALLDIGRVFEIGPEQASQTLSCYFASFAVGVLTWGWLSDQWGRRAAMLMGLTVYAIGSVAALLVNDFNGLLFARIVAAFGAAAGSVVTQTIMRDRLHGPALLRAYSVAGIAIALSPAIGLLSGSVLTQIFGYRGIFWLLSAVAGLLIAWCLSSLDETRPTQENVPSMWRTAVDMARDPQIWMASLLITFGNVSLFSYYTLAPFLISRIGLPTSALALGGVLLALGSIVGGRLNMVLSKRGVSASTLLGVGLITGLLGSVLVLFFQNRWFFMIAMMLVNLAFAMVVPLILGRALISYADRRGGAGALLGLSYYLLVGSGLALAGWGQNLGGTLLLCATFSVFIGWRYRHYLAHA